MRKISVTLIKEKLNQLVIQANTDLREDLLAALKQAVKKEKHQLARRALSAIIENAKIAKKEKLPICQDILSEIHIRLNYQAANFLFN